MGCCCSCLDQTNGSSADEEMEMQAQISEANKTLSVARGMSAPSIEVEDRTKVSGFGLAITAVVLEQDAAYWEVHVELPEGKDIEAMFGVATKKDRKFYDSNSEGEEKQGTELMCAIKVTNKVVIGVCMQQSDLPMLQFYLNSEQLHDKSINRFRGSVYPAVYLPVDNEGLKLRFVFRENEFQKSPPSSRFCPVMVARGLV